MLCTINHIISLLKIFQWHLTGYRIISKTLKWKLHEDKNHIRPVCHVSSIWHEMDACTHSITINEHVKEPGLCIPVLQFPWRDYNSLSALYFKPLSYPLPFNIYIFSTWKTKLTDSKNNKNLSFSFRCHILHS